MSVKSEIRVRCKEGQTDKQKMSNYLLGIPVPGTRSVMYFWPLCLKAFLSTVLALFFFSVWYYSKILSDIAVKKYYRHPPGACIMGLILLLTLQYDLIGIFISSIFETNTKCRD